MTDTLLLDRLTAEETKLTCSTRPVTRQTPSPGTSYNDIETWLITSVDHGSDTVTDTRRERYLNTVRNVRNLGAEARPGLQSGPTIHDYLRAEGAPMNPPLVNGRHYTLFNNGQELYTVRYNDDDHLGDRHSQFACFSVITGAGAAWPHERDAVGIGVLDTATYIEVHAPEIAGQPAVSVDAQAGEAGPEYDDGAVAGPTLGLAAKNGAGRVEINPERTGGVFYLAWNGSGQSVTLAQWRDGAWKPCGYYSRRYNDEITYNPGGSAVIGDDWKWALARVERPAVPEDFDAEARKRSVRNSMNDTASKWTQLDEALQSLAKDKDWCSEFESFAEPLGFSARENKGDWEVYVDVRISASIDSPDSSVDSRIESTYDLPSLSTTSLSLEGTIRVCVSVDDCTEEYARDYISTDVLMDAIDSSMEVEIHDYTIDSVSGS